jgi:TetR/AcrR family transcriptional regulator, transcriptional repressor for nem operon
MGVSKQQAAENRRAILEASEKLFREHGIDGIGLSALMKQAGFTQGGFYNHFASKEALAAEVVATAMARANADLKAAIAAPLAAGQTRLGRQVDYYLSDTHCSDVGRGCAVAALSTEVRRLGGEAQMNFAAGLREMIDTIVGLVAEQQPGLGAEAARERAIALYCEMVGALFLARAVAEADPGLAEMILASGRHALMQGRK